jgi:hypothetical protein
MMRTRAQDCGKHPLAGLRKGSVKRWGELGAAQPPFLTAFVGQKHQAPGRRDPSFVRSTKACAHWSSDVEPADTEG